MFSSKSFYLLLPLIIVALLLFLLTRPVPQAIQTPGITPSRQFLESNPDEAIEIKIWGQAGEKFEHWRVDGIVKVAENAPDFHLKPMGVAFADDDAFKEAFIKVAAVGQAPDIIYAGLGDILAWSQAGYLIPFDACRARYSEFEDVLDPLWRQITWQGRVWGVPHHISTYVLFFNKVKLRELGWSQEEIRTLPERIRRGEFTLDDLTATAKDAVAQGVIEPDFGYWFRPAQASRERLLPYLAYEGRVFDSVQSKLVINQEALQGWYTFQRKLVDENLTPENLLGQPWNTGVVGRSLYHDTVTHGRVLFWVGGLWYWLTWESQYVPDMGGRAYLYDLMGYALMPSGFKNRPGATAIGIGFYAIVSEQASNRKNQEAACALLAKVTTPEINTLNAVEALEHGVLKSQATYPAYTAHPLLTETGYMLNYSQLGPEYPINTGYSGILWEFMLKAENGEMSPSEAARTAVETLQREIGDDLIVE
jgi:inositol-phosphate transport system substrate-binding protein